MKSPPPLILASTSSYRRELLTRLKIPFESRAPGTAESRLPGETAMQLPVRLARAKATAVAENMPDAWVIGSDQVAILAAGGTGEQVLGKPGNAANCSAQLRRCSGAPLLFVTAVAVLRMRDAAVHEFTDVTRVTFCDLGDDTIERYVAREQPFDCAGGFKSEGLGIALCRSIETTDPTALIGLPLLRLAAVLRSVGFEIP